MAQQMNNLFDPQRRKALREAIRKGERIFAGRGQVEPPSSSSGLSFSGDLMRITSSEVLLSDPPQIRVGARTYHLDDYLMLAIQYGDLDAMKLAISEGANVNHEVIFLPANPDCDDVHPTRIGDPTVKTPLQYAKKLGKADMVEFLRQNGAKE